MKRQTSLKAGDVVYLHRKQLARVRTRSDAPAMIGDTPGFFVVEEARNIPERTGHSAGDIYPGYTEYVARPLDKDHHYNPNHKPITFTIGVNYVRGSLEEVEVWGGMQMRWDWPDDGEEA